MAEHGGAEGNRTLEKEDRLSALPDSLIHHILSFLPSTRHAIQTGILSKRWLNQWTFVSNLVFDFSDYSHENIPLTTSAIFRIVEQTLNLHQCSKLHKFHIITDWFIECIYDPFYKDLICSVVRKQAEEIILNLKFSEILEIMLPESFFCQPLLVNLRLFGCSIQPTGVLNWKSLKYLSIGNCYFTDGGITSIVSGSPSLQSLEVDLSSVALSALAIASTSLRRLVLFGIDFYVDILCPNLLEFDSLGMDEQNCGWSDEVLEKLLSNSPFLESLELRNFMFSNLRIASKVMKKLVFKGRISHEIAISCPHLEELWLTGSVQNIRVMNLPSSVCVSLDLEYREGLRETVVKQILESVQHTNELKLGINFIEILSALEMDGISYPSLNTKCLTLSESCKSWRGHIFTHIAGIVFLLRCSPLLERLTVNLHKRAKDQGLDLSVSDHPEENYWKSDGTHLSGLVSHLRHVQIFVCSYRHYKPKRVLDFIEFLLKNGSVLEKMVVMLNDCETDFVTKVSQKLLSFPRCSNTTIELVCPQ